MKVFQKVIKVSLYSIILQRVTGTMDVLHKISYIFIVYF